MTEYQYLFFAERYTSLAAEVLERLKTDSYAADEAYQGLLDVRAVLLSGMLEIEEGELAREAPGGGRGGPA